MQVYADLPVNLQSTTSFSKWLRFSVAYSMRTLLNALKNQFKKTIILRGHQISFYYLYIENFILH